MEILWLDLVNFVSATGANLVMVSNLSVAKLILGKNK
jgi:hypothetical protein